MELTKERGIRLISSNNAQELIDFLFEYCRFHNKDEFKTQIFLQYIAMNGELKPLVNSVVYELLQKQNISITILIDTNTNTIIKYF